MDPMDPQEVLRQAREALAGGKYTPEEVDKVVAENSDYPNFFALRLAVEAQDATDPVRREHLSRAAQFASEAAREITPAQRRMNEGGSAAGDFAALAGNAASFGFLDELVGLASPRAAEGMRQRVSDVREENPLWATLAAEGAGGLLFPGGVIANVGRGGGLGRAAVTGALTGAAAGGLTGLGEAEGSLTERLPSAGVGAGVGAATGLLAGPVIRTGQAVIQRARGPANSRLARGLAEIGGEADAPEGLFGRIRSKLAGGPRTRDVFTPDAARQQIQNEIQATGERLYRPFENVGPSRELKDMIRQLAGEPGIRTAVEDPAVARGLLTDPPDFSNVRRIRARLQKLAQRENDPNGTFSKLFRRFDEEMQVAYPGVGEANREFARAAEVGEAFDMGFNRSRRAGRSASEGIAAWRRPAEVREMLRTFEDNPAAQDAMRRGMRNRLLEDLYLRRTGTPAQVKMFMDADEGGQALMRELFPATDVGDEQFLAFKRLLRDNALPETVLRQLRTSAKWTSIAAALGAAGAAGGHAVTSLFP